MSLAGPAFLFECCVSILFYLNCVLLCFKCAVFQFYQCRAIQCGCQPLSKGEVGEVRFFCLQIVTFHFENSQPLAFHFGSSATCRFWTVQTFPFVDAGRFGPSERDLSCYGLKFPFMGLFHLSFLEPPSTGVYCIIRQGGSRAFGTGWCISISRFKPNPIVLSISSPSH